MELGEFELICALKGAEQIKPSDNVTPAWEHTLQSVWSSGRLALIGSGKVCALCLQLQLSKYTVKLYFILLGQWLNTQVSSPSTIPVALDLISITKALTNYSEDLYSCFLVLFYFRKKQTKNSTPLRF